MTGFVHCYLWNVTLVRIKAMQIANGVHWVGALDPNLRIFDIIMQTERGTTYNAYLVQGQKSALIETVKAGFTQNLLKNLSGLIDLKSLDYIVINHAEPDHSGALAALLDLAPQVQVLASRAGCMFCKEIVNRPFNCREVKDGEELDLGGKRLKFILAPFLHWPDSIFTYLVEDRILFTCDAFGAHYCGECQLFADQIKIDGQLEAFKYYYDHILRPFKEYVLQALDKIETLPLKIIAPSHGPLLRRNLDEYKNLYRQWSQLVKTDPRKAVIVFVSAYGNTKAMARAIGEGLKAGGKGISIHDATLADFNQLRDEIEGAQALLIGSPTINYDALKPVWDVLSNLATIKLKGKIGAAFGSYGWSGEAVPMLTQRMRDLKMNVAVPGMRCLLVPTESNLEECRLWGQKIAEMMG
ncbi:MAG: FprA family A-type flavoprotein [Candidatus Schekmanbacteria bacterium]|nr:FprA family A-type flavoprotein [Candidatus Schekmanbacteria bacterium]